MSTDSRGVWGSLLVRARARVGWACPALVLLSVQWTVLRKGGWRWETSSLSAHCGHTLLRDGPAFTQHEWQ